MLPVVLALKALNLVADARTLPPSVPFRVSRSV
jgi:hypothetical protein